MLLQLALASSRIIRSASFYSHFLINICLPQVQKREGRETKKKSGLRVQCGSVRRAEAPLLEPGRSPGASGRRGVVQGEGGKGPRQRA